VIYLVFALWMGLGAGIVGRIKGSSFFIWFVIGLVLPVLGLLAAVFYRSDHDEVRRQCPTCGKIIKLHDTMCMRCGTDLDFPEVAIEPESAAIRR
jgi:membrane protein implicated in regulation of membrane protease activity